MLNRTKRGSPDEERVKRESPMNVAIPANGTELKPLINGNTSEAKSTPPGTLFRTYMPYGKPSMNGSKYGSVAKTRSAAEGSPAAII
jgi:hypothetical protein